MKKVYFVVLTATTLLLSSCVTSMKTATTMDIHPSVRNVTVADLDVAPERITYRMVPSKAIQRGGIENVKQAAENEALQKNGNADILVEPQFVYAIKNGRVKSIEVTGRPAYYTNFRSLPDTVWSNPYFNGLSPVAGSGKGLNLGNALGGLFGGKSSAEKEQSVKKVRNPYRSTGFHAYFDLYVGPTTNTGKAMFVDKHPGSRWYNGTGGYALTLGGQLDEQLFVGLGASALFAGSADDFYLDETEGALNRFFEKRWIKYSYTHIEGQDWREPEPVSDGTFIFDYDDTSEMIFVPIYANARYYFSPKKVSSFVDLKLGLSKEVSKKSIDGGIFFSPSVGIGLRRLHVTLSYVLQGATYSTRFKNEIDDFFGALNSCDSEQWEHRGYVSYYDGFSHKTVSGDKNTESEFLDALRYFRDNPSWFSHSLTLSVGLRF